jgi:hypothetical protein
LEYEKEKSKGNKSISVPAITKSGITQYIEIKTIICNVVEFLMAQRTENFVWSDKWNKSPYYTTFKVVDTLLFLASHYDEFKELNLTADELKKFCWKSINWALKTQHEDGSWGEPSIASQGNLEETSYAVRLLKTGKTTWSQDINILNSLQKGQKYLINHLDEMISEPNFFYDKQPFLWISKSLYTVPNIIKISVLVAAYEEKD